MVVQGDQSVAILMLFQSRVEKLQLVIAQVSLNFTWYGGIEHDQDPVAMPGNSVGTNTVTADVIRHDWIQIVVSWYAVGLGVQG